MKGEHTSWMIVDESISQYNEDKEKSIIKELQNRSAALVTTAPSPLP